MRLGNVVVRCGVGAMAGLLLDGCAAAQGSHTGAAPAPPAPAREVFGSVDGTPIDREQVEGHVGDELLELVNELEQRRMHLYWVGLEDAIAGHLLAAEAERLGTSVDNLVEQQTGASIEAPTDDEVRAYYDENRELIELPYDVAAPELKAQMLRDQRTQARQQLVAALRDKADVRYALPVPDLPRFPVQTDDAPVRGPPHAPITLIAFSDFQCAYCARARHVLDRLAELYPKSLRIVFRDFPLAQHTRAQQAAEAAQCAREQDKFWQYHDLLFDNAHGMDEGALRRYATEADLTLDAFERCMASERPKAAVAASVRAARRLGVRGTPSVFVNGIKLIGLFPVPIMQALIDGELQRSHRGQRPAP